MVRLTETTMTKIFIYLLLLLFPSMLASQNDTTYISTHGTEVNLPNGKVSFADKVIDYEVGEFTKIKAGFRGLNPNGAIGEPDFDVKASESGECLGCNAVCLGCGGQLILEFTDNAIIDVDGPDIFIFELGVFERTKLSISKDLTNWIDIGILEGGTSAVDISKYVKKNELFYFIKLKGLKENCVGFYPGADIDAVAAIGSTTDESLGITIPAEKEFNISNKDVEVIIWDNGKEDGAIVDVYLNGKPILLAEEVRKNGTSMTLSLESGNNIFEIRALKRYGH